jgi:5'-3' exonuclease
MSAVVETTRAAPPETAAPQVVLIDLSSIAHPIFHVTASDPDPNRTSIDTVAKVRALASGQPHVAICCDAPPYLRKTIDPDYKANRPESDATLQHQITLARETLLGDGFPVWAVKGFEADDLIATGARLAQEAGLDVLVVSSDKDLLQLVNGHVKAKSLRDGSILDEEAVGAKFGVRPEQIRDYLSLVGDASDNVKGAKGIGPKKAAALLEKYGTLDRLYRYIHETGHQELGIKPSEALSLDEFEGRYPTVRSLIALRDDVPIPFTEIMADRVPKDAAAFIEEKPMEAQANVTLTPMFTNSEPAPETPTTSAALAFVHEAELVAPAEWEMQLEPRSMREAKILASDMFSSRLFSAYGTAPAILSTIMAGRELGLQAMASLRAFHLIEGKPTLAADLIRALIIKSGKAKFFRCSERTAERATFETQRGDDPPVSLTYTVEEKKADGPIKPGSAWAKSPADMCVARASSKLARLVFPDVVHGLYAHEEMENGNG